MRQEAMKWWNKLTPEQKTEICNSSTELVGSSRKWESLTGREIQLIYEDIKIVRELFETR